MLKNAPRKPVDHDRDRRWIPTSTSTWTRERGFLHTAIDSGASRPTANRTPILVPDGAFPAQDVRREFVTRGAPLPAEIRELVLTRIAEFASRLPTG
jgi:hypothetical protein